MSLFETHSDGAPLRLAVAWLGAVLGSVTLQQVVLLLTAVYTAIQIYLLVRDKVLRKGRAKHES